jgi:hypothetical protein
VLKEGLKDSDEQLRGVFKRLDREMDAEVALQGIELAVYENEDNAVANVSQWDWDGNPKSDFVIAFNEVVLGARVTLIGWRNGVESWRDCVNWMSHAVS